MEYRKEVKDPWLLAARTTTSPWTSVKHCEIIVDYRKRQVVEHALIHINRTEVDCLRRFLGGSFKFLAVHISNDFKWSTHIHTVMRTARQHLYFLTSLHHWTFSVAASQPGMAAVPWVTTGTYREWWNQLSTTSAGNCPLCRTFTWNGAWVCQKDHQGQQSCLIFPLLSSARHYGAPK